VTLGKNLAVKEKGWRARGDWGTPAMRRAS
jgi:hypothetical protein